MKTCSVVRCGQICLDPYEPVLRVAYSIERQDTGRDSAKIEHNVVRVPLNNLTAQHDLRSFSRKVVEECKYLSEQSLPKVEAAVQQLFQRQFGSGMFTPKTKLSNGANVSIANMNLLQEYVETMYEEDSDCKIRGALKVLELALDAANLENLAENHQLMSLLSRILREDCIKCTTLAHPVLLIFYAISRFDKFHNALSNHKVGITTLSIVELVLDEWQSGQNELALENKHIILAGLQLLLNLADDEKTLEKMSKKGILKLSTKCLSMNEVLIVWTALKMMKKLCIYEENVANLEEVNSDIVNILSELLYCSHQEILLENMQVLYNLSFSEQICNALKEHAIVRIASLTGADQEEVRFCSIAVLYQASRHRYLEVLHQSDCLSFLIDAIPEDGSECDPLIALFLNLMNHTPFLDDLTANKLLHKVLLREPCLNMNVLMLKLLRRLSGYTLALQHRLLQGEVTEEDCSEQIKGLPKTIDGYKVLKLWPRYSEYLIQRLLEKESEEGELLEILGVLQNLTENDLPDNTRWIDVAARLTEKNVIETIFKSEPDVILEMIILLRRICIEKDLTWKLMTKNVIENMIDSCTAHISDSAFTSEVLALLDQSLCLGINPWSIECSDALVELVVICRISSCLVVRQLASRCGFKLIEISRKDNGEICEYGNKLISRQFAVHCQAWLDPRNQELISEPKEQTDLAA